MPLFKAMNSYLSWKISFKYFVYYKRFVHSVSNILSIIRALYTQFKIFCPLLEHCTLSLRFLSIIRALYTQFKIFCPLLEYCTLSLKYFVQY